MSTTTAAPVLHRLPALKYPFAALEPYVDARTLQLHHEVHHGGYVEKLNSAVAPFPMLHSRTALSLLLDPRLVPQEVRAAVRNNAGGHVNHSLFWLSMSANGPRAPTGPLAEAIVRDFGSLEQFKTRFVEAGEAQFGSGWVWLTSTTDRERRLGICTTSGHDNPVRQGLVPLLLNDLWEHAYYLAYQNRRGEYLRNWWQVTDWKEAERRFEELSATAAQAAG